MTIEVKAREQRREHGKQRIQWRKQWATELGSKEGRVRDDGRKRLTSKTYF